MTSAFGRLCRARDLLRETDDGRLSIEDVARETAVSRFHFIRRFHAMFGETPHQFRIRARLERAKHLLAVSDYSVTDVCMEVGFSSLGSFSDLFARRVGMSPSAYRRRIRARARLANPGRGADAGMPHADGRRVRNFREAIAGASVRLDRVNSGIAGGCG